MEHCFVNKANTPVNPDLVSIRICIWEGQSNEKVAAYVGEQIQHSACWKYGGYLYDLRFLQSHQCFDSLCKITFISYWNEFVMYMLCGSKQQVNSIYYLFNSDLFTPGFGMDYGRLKFILFY